MALVVLDAPVLASAIEGDRHSANLLAWLAYGGGVDSAVDELMKVEKLVREDIGVRKGGPRWEPLNAVAERSRDELFQRLRGLPSGYGLATSGGILDAMCAILEQRRAHTWVNASSARLLVAACAARFTSEDDLAGVRKQAPGRITARMQVALAEGARYVVVRSLADRDTVPTTTARRLARWVAPVPFIGRSIAGRITSVPTPTSAHQGPAERLMPLEDDVVETVTTAEFMAADDVPDLAGLNGTLELLKTLYAPGV